MTVLVLATKILDVSQLLRVIATALVAGIGVSLAFSLVIYGSVRAGEHRQRSRPLAAGLHAVVAILALAACAGAIVFGVSVMLSK